MRSIQDRIVDAARILLYGTEDLNTAIKDLSDVLAEHDDVSPDNIRNRLLLITKKLDFKTYEEFSSDEYIAPPKANTPVCATCNDTHQMWFTSTESYVMCTRCPVPCGECNSGPYCKHTPCKCQCHINDEQSQENITEKVDAVIYTCYRLWIDDDVYTDGIDDFRRPPIGEQWEIASSSAEAIKTIEDYGCAPAYISFDHDLGLKEDGTADTAKEVCKYLFEHYPDADIEYDVHSKNPEGAAWIKSFMDSWKKSLNL
jgi:hypothetical protein